MIIEHPLNLELSKEVYEECEHFIKNKECYTNVFYTINYFLNEFESGEWKIAYGYIKILKSERLFARHCFIVNSNGEAIDPTLFTLNYFNEEDDANHISFYIFENLDSYTDAILNNDNFPDLIKPLMKIEMETVEIWAKENNCFLIR